MNIHVVKTKEYDTPHGVDPYDLQTPNSVCDRLRSDGWFQRAGAYCVVDGQYGSTGKGLLSSVLGEVAARTGRLPTLALNLVIPLTDR